jgi:hypothetical protein
MHSNSINQQRGKKSEGQTPGRRVSKGEEGGWGNTNFHSPAPAVHPDDPKPVGDDWTTWP